MGNGPKTGLWSSVLGKTFQDKPQERNPNQTAREMEELAKGPDSSAKHARDMEGLDGSEPSQDDLILPVLPGSKGVQSGKGPLTGDDETIRQALKQAQGKSPGDAKSTLDDEVKALEKQKKQASGKEKTKIQKRIDKLKGALKVLPRYYKGVGPFFLLPHGFLLEETREMEEAGEWQI